MAKWIIAVYTDSADPAREAEFNEWYDQTHLPDVLKYPGITRATRYQNISPEGGPGNFLAIYEVESDDIEQTLAGLRDYLAELRAKGRYSDLLVRVSLATYQQISSRSRQ